MTKILVVDDDLALSDVLAFAFRRAGFEVANVHDGLSALKYFTREGADMIVLDWGLPRMDGLEVCTRIRAVSDVPIVMLTVRDSDDNVIAALDAEADEYIVKPFSPRQLIARMRPAAACLNGSARTAAAGPLVFDADRQVRFGEGSGTLDSAGEALLRALMQESRPGDEQRHPDLARMG
jgi:DNA-binding response OmpR family regulator